MTEVGPAGPLRPNPPAERLALERRVQRQAGPVHPAVRLQPPLPATA
ncbi:hypothetical protein ACIRYZ_37280 [Kitasatospora sp. NPDC101155]